MIAVTIQNQGEDVISFSKRMLEDNDEMLVKLEVLGKAVHSFMQQTITSNIKRPGSTGNFVRAIQYGKLENGGFWVGDINHLNEFAKQWRWLNYGRAGTGRRIPPGTDENSRIKGQFSPGEARPMGSAFGQGRFKKGFYAMNPKKAITPMNFIEKSIHKLENELGGVIGASSKTVFGKGFKMTEELN